MPEFQDSNKEPIYTLHLLEIGYPVEIKKKYNRKF